MHRYPLAAGAVLCCLASGAASAATYACSESNVASGETPRALTLHLDLENDSASIATGDGAASGLVQTTLDAHLGRLAAPNGRIYLLMLHRHTGRMTLTAESPAEGEVSTTEFVGTCVAN